MILEKNELQAKARKYWLEYFEEEIEQLNQLMLEAAIKGEVLVEFNALEMTHGIFSFIIYILKKVMVYIKGFVMEK